MPLSSAPAELSATFELWAHKGQAQYQLHLAEALTLYQQALPLKEMFFDQVKHFDRVRKNCQHKVDACRKELKQAQGRSWSNLKLSSSRLSMIMT